MNKEKYREELKDPRWLAKRKEILLLDEFKCRRCGTEKGPLNVHHLYYVDGRHAWEYYNDQLITLCEQCHFEIHNEEKSFDMGAKIGQVYEREHGDWTYSAICYFIDYINKRVYLLGTDTCSNWDNIRQEVVSFAYFKERFTYRPNFFNWKALETYEEELLTKGLFYYMKNKGKTKLSADTCFVVDENRLRDKLDEVFMENEVLWNNYISFCNDEFYFDNI